VSDIKNILSCSVLSVWILSNLGKGVRKGQTSSNISSMYPSNSPQYMINVLLDSEVVHSGLIALHRIIIYGHVQSVLNPVIAGKSVGISSAVNNMLHIST